MYYHKILSTLAFTTAVFISATTSIQADEGNRKQEKFVDQETLETLLREAMPGPVSKDLVGLVEKMSRPDIGEPMAERFDAKQVAETLLKSSAPSDCRTQRSGRTICLVEEGENAGSGAYQVLKYDQQMNFGNLVYLRRERDQALDPAKLPSIDLADEQAYQLAQSLLVDLVGVSEIELPKAPRNAKVRFPVKTIAYGWNDGKGNAGSAEVEKTVTLKRGLYVGLGQGYDWVPAPGKARVVVDINGVKELKLRNWQTLDLHPDAQPAQAKNVDGLVREMASDLVDAAQGPVAGIRTRIAYGSMTTDEGIGLLYPVLQVAVSPVGRDLSESQQQGLVSTAGVIREYPLVNLTSEIGKSVAAQTDND